MTILGVVLMWLACGLICWAVYKFAAQIPNGFKTGLCIFLIAVCVIYSLSTLGLLGSLNAPVPRVGRN